MKDERGSGDGFQDGDGATYCSCKMQESVHLCIDYVVKH